jgi:2-desacetyl-2-hydroxyethyl bacteriochlorophyllide A dehydrogenase
MALQLVFSEPQRVAYEDSEVGAPAAGQVRVKTILSGISHGTEMVAFLGKAPFLHKKMTAERTFAPREPSDPSFYPFRYAGYDSVGEVVAVGDGVAQYAVGDRVSMALPHATERIVDAANPEVLKLQRDTNPEDAIMMSLGTVAFVAAQDAEIKLGDTVAVIGGGAVGQLAVQMAFLQGAVRVFLVEPNPGRRKLAASLTTAATMDPLTEIPAAVIRRDNGGHAPDVVIECSGTIRGLKTAIQCAGVAGTVVATGFYAEPSTELILGEEFLHNRITLKASMGVWGCPSRWPLTWNRARNLRTVLDLIEARRLRFDGFVSLRVPFAEAQRGYETIRDEPGHLKVVLTSP